MKETGFLTWQRVRKYILCTWGQVGGWVFGGFPDSSVSKEPTCNARDPSLIPGLGRSTEEEIGYPLQYSWASLVTQVVKESACNVEDLGSLPGLWRSPGEGKGYPLQCSGLENSMDCVVHGGRKVSDTTEGISLSLGGWVYHLRYSVDMENPSLWNDSKSHLKSLPQLEWSDILAHQWRWQRWRKKQHVTRCFKSSGKHLMWAAQAWLVKLGKKVDT